MKAASYPLSDKATQRHHPADERVPRGILLSVSVRLDPQAVTHGGDGAMEQLSPLGLGLEEALEGGGRRLSHLLFLLQFWNTGIKLAQVKDLDTKATI
jgi:hypothetical protein